MHDLRFAVRSLLKSPGLTFVVVGSLALGIGALATVICWIRHLVIEPLPGVSRSQELVVLVSNSGSGPVSLPDLQDFVAETGLFSGALAAMATPAVLTIEDQPGWINAQIMSANGFDVLGVKPLLGRTFLPDEDQKPGGDPVLVISEALWRRLFAADPSVIDRAIELNRHAFTIIGVIPDTFVGTGAPAITDAWVPLSMIWEVRNQGTYFLDQRAARGWHNLARLKPGVSVDQAHAAVSAVNARLAIAHPETNRQVTHRVVPLSDSPWSAQSIVGPTLRLLLVVCAGVLLIVAANVANLLLARASGRQKEIAIRLAAGASRWRLVRQLLVESVLLACCGGVLGLIVASWAVDVMPWLLPVPPTDLHLVFSLDATTLGWTLLITLATGLIFGLGPALQASRSNLNEILKDGGRSISSGPAQNRLRRMLVVAELAVAIVLLVGAGLCGKGLARARTVEVGFDPERVLLGDLRIGMNGYDPDTGSTFYRQLRERLANLPGVEEAALASWLPLGLFGCKGTDVRVDGYNRPEGENLTYEYAIISPRYFAALRVPLLAGRDFSDADDAAASPVAIVNEAFAERFWPGLDPVGRKFRGLGRDLTIVGLAKTGKYNRLDEPPSCFFYVPYLQGVPDLDLGICLRTQGDPLALAGGMRQVVRELDPGVGLQQVRPLTTYMEATFFAQRMASLLLNLLAGVALALAALGVFAVMSYSVSQRIPEFGVRLALGASTGRVLGEVLKSGLKLAMIGGVIGVALALALTRLLASFLYGVSPFDPVTLITVPLLLTVVTLLASWLPARRATRVNPVEALRAE